MIASPKLVRFDCCREAFVEHPYPDGTFRDGTPRWSWGFGTLAPLVGTIMVEQALLAVREHFAKNDPWFKDHLHVELTQEKYDALCSLAYQNWAGGVKTVELITSGEKLWLDTFPQWNKNSKGERKEGLSARRAREMNLGYNGEYGDISRYKVYAGTPLTFVEWREFPAEMEI